MQELAESMACSTWNKFCELYPALDRTLKPLVKFDGRFRTRGGQADIEKFTIRLSPHLFAAYPSEFGAIIIPHEIAHLIDFTLNGIIYEGEDTDLHRESWKQIMIRYGLPPDEFHNLRVS